MNAPATGWQVRAATHADLPRLVAWACAMAAETEGKALDAATVEAGIAAGLADPERARYFIASRHLALAGRETIDAAAATLMLTREWSDWRNGWWWWIQSVYVDPAHRRGGAYRALHEHVAALARAAPDVVGLRLYVERDNANAQATYAALGMQQTGYDLWQHAIERDTPRD